VIEKCPNCGGTEGYSIEYVESFSRIYWWDGEFAGTTEGMMVVCYKTAYCVDCGKGIRVSTLDRLNANGGDLLV